MMIGCKKQDKTLDQYIRQAETKTGMIGRAQEIGIISCAL